MVQRRFFLPVRTDQFALVHLHALPPIASLFPSFTYISPQFITSSAILCIINLLSLSHYFPYAKPINHNEKND